MSTGIEPTAPPAGDTSEATTENKAPTEGCPGAPEAPPRYSLRRDVSFPAVLAGLIAVIVSYSGPLVVVLAAARAGHLDEAHTASWVWAVSIGSGLTCLFLSWRTRMPVITAWSTPGVALLMTNLGDYPYAQAIGAFLISAAAIAVIGYSGLFGRLMRAVPTGVVNAMLAGILFSFGVSIFTELKTSPAIVLSAFIAFFAMKRLSVRWAVPVALLAGAGAALVTTRLDFALGGGGVLVRPVLTMPDFSLAALIGIAIPLAVVTLASQNAPGTAVLEGAGYTPDDRLLVGSTGAMSFLLAPFGSHAVNLAAITAAICTGPEAHPDPRRRYIAGMSCGIWYLLIGSCGGVLVLLFAGLPAALIAVVAGVALLGALQSSLTTALGEVGTRDAAVVTFLCTASGMSLFGIGSAFWGLLLGLLTHALLKTRLPRGDRKT
ncbi:benzoate/H(+) symporter BenE family transporter [Streptomyces sp. 15-116A]|uniref:benzoate/H(+) symporter BenE family transporter n=1 Tax=Streptomyces sp. 15-116A TaxID=2259035 RepID=UPI0021B28434|nr:benzoate/H(+) symporter BenE family transporter [Streptomyces sp. 15-116A]MCT7350775.1 benzoate/H(+) symporter BenE family transporter [Streptomyces sp. 15-116A]